MLWDAAALLGLASWVMTLDSGDAIRTGKSEGVGPQRAGDVCEVSINRLGTLLNPVVVSATVQMGYAPLP